MALGKARGYLQGMARYNLICVNRRGDSTEGAGTEWFEADNDVAAINAAKQDFGALIAGSDKAELSRQKPGAGWVSVRVWEKAAPDA